ncbi:MAG: patatin family protein [Enterocloster asparagiformis]|nr:patatin family protein [Enterocloster asparagiformis]
MNTEKTGLVLEGGAMRGIYVAGVLDVLLEHSVHVDGVIGVSAGAIHGCSFVSGQRGRSIRYNLKYCRDPQYMSFRSLLRTGDLCGTDFCYRQLPETLDPFDNDAFEASETKFYVTCTDVETGEPVYKLCETLRGDQIDWVRASASMPLAAHIVELEGRKLLDGGVSDSIPAAAFRKLGYKRCVVVTTRPFGYRKKPNRMVPLLRRAYRGYPKFVEAMARRHLMYNRQLDELQRMEQAGEILVIRPSRAIPIRRTEHNPERIKQMYDLGRRDGESALEQVMEFLNGKANLF